MVKRPSRSITMTFLKGFEEEFDYVSKLKKQGINRSHWICTAVKEKIEKDKARSKEMEKLKEDVEKLKSQIRIIEEKATGSNVVYIDKKEEKDPDLAKAASSFFGLSE